MRQSKPTASISALLPISNEGHTVGMDVTLRFQAPHQLTKKKLLP
jgi:hypothetical protein